jgi:ABC-type nitrate/sulfonate/bicarbonate transport system substrate-binding protein
MMRSLAVRICALLAVGAVGCNTSSTEDRSPPASDAVEHANEAVEHTNEAPTQLRIGLTPHCSSAPVFAARAIGALQRHNVDANFVRFVDGKDAMDALQRGEVDLALAGDLAISAAALDEKGVRVLAVVSRAGYDHWIVARDSIATPEDLRGKTIAVPRLAPARFVLDAILLHHQMTEADVHLKFMPFERTEEALKSGEIDAFIVPEPLHQSAKSQLGNEYHAIADHDGYHTAVALSTLDAFKTKHPEAVRAFMRALGEGVEAATKGPLPFARTIQEQFGKLEASDNPITAECQHLQFSMRLDGELVKRFQMEAEWFTKHDAKATLDVNQLIDPTVLAAVRPSAVLLDKLEK